MTKDEADELWNHPRCPRCPALEDRLKAAIMANISLKKGMDRVMAELEAAVKDNKRLQSVIATSGNFLKWGQA